MAQLSLGSPRLTKEDPLKDAIVEQEPHHPSQVTEYHLPRHPEYLKKNSLDLFSYSFSGLKSEGMAQISPILICRKTSLL